MWLFTWWASSCVIAETSYCLSNSDDIPEVNNNLDSLNVISPQFSIPPARESGNAIISKTWVNSLFLFWTHNLEIIASILASWHRLAARCQVEWSCLMEYIRLFVFLSCQCMNPVPSQICKKLTRITELHITYIYRNTPLWRDPWCKTWSEVSNCLGNSSSLQTK